MKINKTSIFVGDAKDNRFDEKQRKENTERKTIDGSFLQAKYDPVAEKKKEAKKKAMKLVGDAFAKEQKIDDDLNGRRDRIDSLKKDWNDASKEVQKINERRKTLREEFAGEENSEEYRQYVMELNEQEAKFTQDARNASKEIMMETNIIRATELESLKTHPIHDVKKQAEDMLEEASKEIVGMLIDETKEHVEEEVEEEKEKAKAAKKKEEEHQKQVDAIKEKKKEIAEFTEDILEGDKEISTVQQGVNAAQQEVKDMMVKMKLIEEEIKGAAVDKTV